MSVTAIKNAIHLWAMNASGYAGDKVVFVHQNAPQVVRPYLAVRLGDVQAIGMDEVQTTYDNGAPLGEEVTSTAVGTREFTVSVQAYGLSTDEDNGPREVLLRLQSYLSLPSIGVAFDAAGISCFDTGSVQVLPEIKPAGFEGRAVLDCRFYSTATASEKSGYIQTVNVERFWGPPDSGTAEDIDI